MPVTTPTAIQKKVLPTSLHVLAWLVLIILPQLIINRYWGNQNRINWHFFSNAAVYGIIFYVNYLWLVPRYYFQDKRYKYVIFAVVVIAAGYFLNLEIAELLRNPEREQAIEEAISKVMKDEKIARPPFRQMQFYYFILLGVIVTVFSIGLKMIEQYTASERRQKELEREKLNSELAFLKNQVSPHFFFNTLNNIYSLVEINTDDARAAILKLSKLMRYLLYESEHGETSLGNEIEFMRHYIDLMELRVSKKVDIDIQLPVDHIDYKVPPLLFIPFIENAFKHGISYREKSFITVKMTTGDNRIAFICENSIGGDRKEKHDENHSGIGLENVTKRLNLLFPEKHKLDIRHTPEIFTVELEIDLTRQK